MKRKSRNLNLKSPTAIWLLAGGSSIVLAAAVVTLTARTVLADARLSRPVVSLTAASPATSQSPDSILAQEEAFKAQQEAIKAQQAAIKRGDKLHGIASWYGGVFNGRKTASGERFNMHALTACHPTLPFGSLVKVINHSNHRSVVVKITDRGDLVEEGRIIDLSYEAAQRLAMAHNGLARVDLVVLSLGSKQP
jgi:rare lipoprotein A